MKIVLRFYNGKKIEGKKMKTKSIHFFALKSRCKRGDFS